MDIKQQIFAKFKKKKKKKKKVQVRLCSSYQLSRGSWV